jgi:hypothetical protein
MNMRTKIFHLTSMKFLLYISLLFISSCALNQTDYEIVGEYECKNACSMANKEYYGFDKKVGCYCGK